MRTRITYLLLSSSRTNSLLNTKVKSTCDSVTISFYAISPYAGRDSPGRTVRNMKGKSVKVSQYYLFCKINSIHALTSMY